MSKNAWMNQEIFEKWFHHQFVPEVKQFLQSTDREPKALLFYDNFSAHPQELISSCGNIVCQCLPPNTTGALQPMDQGPINHAKESYKIKATNKALRQMDTNTVVEYLFNKFTIKDVIDIAANAWNDFPESFIAKSWHQLGLNLKVKIDLSRLDSTALTQNFFEQVNAPELQEVETESEPAILQSKPKPIFNISNFLHQKFTRLR